MRQRAVLVLCSLMLALSAACGGGGSSSTSTTSSSVQTTPAPPALAITTNQLPSGLQGHAYSATLSATGGNGALHWSLGPNSSSLAAAGLALDANGVLSGTLTSTGQFFFTAQVVDSSAPPLLTTKQLLANVYGKLTASAVPPQTMSQYQLPPVPFILFSIRGGVPPLRFSATSLPPGVRLDPNGNLLGGPIQTGTFQSTVSVQDSFTPPEMLAVPVNITVTHAPMEAFRALPIRLALNQSFSGPIVVLRGGTKPYEFSMTQTSLPPGLTGPDPVTGFIAGTPTAAGSYDLNVTYTDSSSPRQTGSASLNVVVAGALGRNDTPTTATPVGVGIFNASISPYVDPPNGTPVPGDGDYYRLIARPGAVIHASTSTATGFLNEPPLLDTVMEITDVNGKTLSTCRQPGDTSTAFNSVCVNDDVSASPHDTDSGLDFQVPANASPALRFLVHVLDFRGDARPDMSYFLNISGVMEPLSIQNAPSPIANVGLQYSQQLFASSGVSPFSWSLLSGALPPGLSISNAGVISGNPTTIGTFSFTIQVSDAAAETAASSFTVQVFP